MATQGRRRALGQHFLRDQGIVEQIADTALQQAKLHQCRALLEIGPGRGAITLPILDKLTKSSERYSEIQSFLLVERDQKFAAEWKNKTSEISYPFQVESGDFLEVPENRWILQTPLAVVSNLPYSVGTAIVVKLAEHFQSIPVMVLMFQAEVAKRLRAEPSTKERGSLSVWIQNQWDVRKLIHVPPRAFSPPPEVDSEVVVLTRREVPHIQLGQDPNLGKLWESLLKACFSQRRKMLRSVIPWRNALELSGVDGTKRAEALNWQEWDQLFQAVKQVTRP